MNISVAESNNLKINQSETTSETIGIVDFKQDGEIHEAEIKNEIMLDPTLGQTIMPEMDVKAFLGRPCRIAQNVFTVLDAVGDAKFNLGRFPRTLFSSIPMWNEKLKGFYGIRYTAVVRLVANPNPFQQGRYMLASIPLGGLGDANCGNVWRDMHAFTVKQRSMLPHVEFDLQCDTEVTLRIPFQSNQLFFNLNSYASSDYGSINDLRIYPYVPFNFGTGANSCSWSVYVHLEDVELFGAAQPQSGLTGTEKEQMKGKIGPIGLTARKISKSANIIARSPLLSTFAKPVAWAADIAAEVAYVFGWSKPTDLAPVGSKVKTILPGFGNVDTADRSKQIAYFSRHEAENADGLFGTDVDELAFVNFLAIPSWFSTVTWSQVSVQDTVLSTFTLSPPFFSNTTAGIVTGVNLMNHSPVSLLADFFQNYRGSFRVTFKFVKTKFHSGRIEVAFYPWFAKGTNPGLPVDSPYVTKTIVDIRTTSEFTVEFPFISQRAYCEVTEPYGTVQISVLESLTSPDTCASTVSIIMEQSCCDDFEFAIPHTSAYSAPFMGVTPQSGCMTFDSPVGNSKIHRSDKYSRICIGESVRSLRQIARLPSRFDYIDPLAAVGKVQLNFLPYANAYPTKNGSTLASSTTTSDFVGLLCSMFMFSKGSMRIKGIATLATKNTAVHTVAAECDAGQYGAPIDFTSKVGIVNTNTYKWMFLLPRQFHKVDDEGIEIQVPQHSRYLCRNNAQLMCNQDSGTNQKYNSDYAPNRRISMIAGYDVTNVFDNFQFSRAMGDDGTAGCFVSIPPMMATGGY